jgi:hypothetical protein
MQSSVGGHQIHNPDVKAFFHTRARHWETSHTGNADPNQSKAVPPDYASQAAFDISSPETPIDWLETVEGGVGNRADTPFANIAEAKVAILAAEKPASDDGFCDATPLCPTFGGGATWVGECIFTQPIVQQAVLNFFEDVARGELACICTAYEQRTH